MSTPPLELSRRRSDQVAPAITAHLGNDTVLFYNTVPIVGADGITSVASVVGSVTDVNQISSFRAGFENKTVANYVNVLPQVQAGGSFSLSRSLLDTIYGSSLSEGVHTLTLQAQDEFGNLSTSFALTFTLDTIAPVIPTLALAAASDSGSSDRDQVTKVNNPTLEGVAEAGSLVLIFRDYGTDDAGRAAVYANSNGIWQAQYTNLADGVHTFMVDAGDVAGNISAFSNPLSITIDSAAPTLTVSSLSNNATLTNNARLSGTANGTGSAIASVSYYFDTLAAGQTPIAVTMQADGSFDAAINFAGISNGAHTLTVKAIDVAGNELTLPSYSVTVNRDIEAPIAPSNMQLTATSDTGTSSSDGITRTTTPTISGQAEAGAIVKLLSDGHVVGQATAGSNGTWQVTTSALADGVHDLTATATDSAGNISVASTVLEVAIDSAAPELYLDTPTNVVLTQQTHLSGFVDGTGSDVAAIQYQFDNLTPVSVTVDDYGDFDQAINYTGVSSGAHTLTVTTTDLAGNVATNQFTVTVNQTITAPTLLAALANDTGVDNADGVTANPTVTGTLTGGSAIAQLWAGFDTTSNAAFTNVTTAINSDGSFTLNQTQLAAIYGGTVPNGNHTLHLQARDGDGNRLSVSDVAFSLDTVNPQLTITSTLDTTPLSNGAHLTGTANGTGSALVALQYQFDNQPAIPLSLNSTGSFDELIDFTGIANGSHTLTISSTDLAGNVTSSQFNVTVQNTGTASSTSLTLSLAADTGTNTTDGITSDPKITGVVTGSQVAKVLVSLDNTSTGVFSDVTSAWGTDGSLTLDAAALADIYGGTLPDGAYTLRLQAVDAQGTVIGVSHVGFSLDSTAPDLNVPGLIDGITWREGQEVLQGAITDFDPGTTVTYYFDGDSANAASLSFDSSGAFNHSLALPQNFGSHTLDVVATDQAGNQQDLKYTFLIKQLLKAVDDETLPTTGGNGGGSGGGGDANQWSSATGGSGGGIWGHPGVDLYGSGMGQEDDPLGGLGDPNTPYADPGSGYGSDGPPPTYMEKLAIILDNVVSSIDTSQHMSQKAVLQHREAVLMEIGDMTQQGGFYNRMAPALHGIYDLANNHPITTRGEATTEGGTLAGQLLADTDAVKVEVYDAELLAAVNSVLVDKYRNAFTSADQTEYRNMVNALMELSRIYAALNPTAPDDQATSTTPDFLDSLWRAQKVVNNEPLSMADIRTEMQRGVKAIGDLLDGVQNPLKAIQFVNNLIQAATNVESLKDDIHDAKFLRELVEFGFEYARLNPTGTANAGSDAINTFLDTLWRGGDVRQAQGGLSEFFDGFGSEAQRIKLLDFEDNLLKADGLLQGAGLQDQKRDVNFIGSLIGLGNAYATLNPISILLNGSLIENEASQFLNTLWKNQDLEVGRQELEEFLQGATSPNKVLEFARDLFTVSKAMNEEMPEKHSSEFLSLMLDLAKVYAALDAILSFPETFLPNVLLKEEYSKSKNNSNSFKLKDLEKESPASAKTSDGYIKVTIEPYNLDPRHKFVGVYPDGTIFHNQAYPYGTQLGFSRDGRTYPYILIVPNGHGDPIRYIPGQRYQLKVGDIILYPTNDANDDPNIDEDNNFNQSFSTSKNFLEGFNYQFVKNNLSPITDIVDTLNPDQARAQRLKEAEAARSAGFAQGQVTADVLNLLQGFGEIVRGGGNFIAGGGLTIASEGTLSVPSLVIATEGAIEFSHGLTVSKSAIDDLLGQGAFFARSSTSGESEQTRRGKEYHRDMVAGRRASSDYDLVNQVMKDKAGNAIEVPYRVDVETGQPLDTRVQRVLPDAVNFEKGLIIDDKPLGRNVLSGDDRQEIIRNITAFKIREGKLPETIEIHRYDLKTGEPAGIEVYTPEQFLPTNSQ